MKMVRRKMADQYRAVFWCPGCNEAHILTERTADNKWQSYPTWEVYYEQCTLSPSVFVGAGTSEVCHSWVVNGYIEFLNDSTHQLAGKRVELPDVPDYLVPKVVNP